MSKDRSHFRAFSLQTFMETIHRGNVALWSWDPEREIAYLDSLAMEFWGASHDEMPMADLWDRVDDDDREATIAAWRASAESDTPYEFNFKITLPNKASRWIAARGMGGTAGACDGEVLAIFVDVTENMQARLTQQTLVREMGHRIANLFSVTNGILQLTRTKHTEVAAFTEDLGQRFAQLSNAYRAIMRSPNEHNGRISVADALSSLLSPYGVSETQINFDLDPTPQIDDQAVTSLALIVHELITNALKYGALSDTNGKLAISLKPDGDAYVFNWTESGAHIDVDRDGLSTGFGERLIRQTADMAFGATVSRAFHNDGLSFVMTVPKDEFGHARS